MQQTPVAEYLEISDDMEIWCHFLRRTLRTVICALTRLSLPARGLVIRASSS